MGLGAAPSPRCGRWGARRRPAGATCQAAGPGSRGRWPPGTRAGGCLYPVPHVLRRDALLPTDADSQGLRGQPRRLCPLAAIAGLPTSPLQAASFGGQRLGAVSCPSSISTSAGCLESRGGGERKKRTRVGRQGEEATEIPTETADAEQPRRERQGCKERGTPEVPPARPGVGWRLCRSEGGKLAHSPPPGSFPFTPGPLPSHPWFTIRAPPTSGGERSLRSTSRSLSRASFSVGGRGVTGGAGSSGGLGPAPRPSPCSEYNLQ